MALSCAGAAGRSVQRDGTAVRFMSLDNAFAVEVQANGGTPDAASGGPGASFNA
jgi:cytochrome c-type biogenesis protein CcmE